MNSKNASPRLTIICELIYAKIRLTSALFEGADGTRNAARWVKKKETTRDNGNERPDEHMNKYMWAKY